MGGEMVSEAACHFRNLFWNKVNVIMKYISTRLQGNLFLTGKYNTKGYETITDVI